MSGVDPAPVRSVSTDNSERTALLRDVISKRERELVSLKLQLNADAYVMRLPDELLLEILYYYVAWWKTAYGHNGFFPSYSNKVRGHHGWVIVTHVCHHWRTVAVSAPLLWTDLKINRQSLAYAFLARSRQAPLSIQCRIVVKDALKKSSKFQAVKAALSQSHRIRSLLFQYSGVDPDTGDSAMASPELGRYEFPQLQNLTLWIDGGYDTTLPSFIARASFPKLKSLETRMYDLSTLGRIVTAPYLTRLKLTAFNGDRSLTWTALSNFFAALPQLEVLILMDGLPRIRTMLQQQVLDLPTFDKVLVLPNLQTLSLTCQGLSCATLLKHMSFPVTTKVRIDFASPLEVFESERGNDFQLIAPVMAACMSGSRLIGSMAPILSLSVDTMIGFDMRLSMWREALPIDSPAADSVDPASRAVHDAACFQIVFRAYSGAAIMTRFCRSLPLTQVRRLFVGELHPNGLPLVPTARQWLELFGFLSKVTHLSVYERSTQRVVAAITPVVHTGTGEERHYARALFPDVQVLKLQYATLNAAALRDWSSQLRQGGWRVRMQHEGEPRYAMVPTKLKQVIVRKAVHVDANHMYHFKHALETNAGIEVDWDEVTRWKGPIPSRKRFARVETEYWVEDEIEFE